MKRAQSAVEFVILASVMFLLFSLTIIVVQKVLVDTTAFTKQETLYEMQLAVMGELSLAQTMPTGYERTFKLPNDIQGHGYTITINTEAEPLRDELIVSFADESRVVYLQQNVSGTLQPGANKLARHDGYIRLN